MKFFLPQKEEAMTEAKFMNLVKERGTEFVLVLFEAPDVVEDILFPQLRKAEASVTELIERNRFRIYSSDVGVEGEKAFLLFELLVWTLPRIKKHIGPPVTSEYHSEQFKGKYATTKRKDLFIENGRYMVEVERSYTDVVGLLKNELKSCSLGKQVAKSIDGWYEVLRHDEIQFSEGLGHFFRGYFRGI